MAVSLSVMLVMIYQAVSQELNLRRAKSRIEASTAEIKKKEEGIVQEKVKLNELKIKLTAVNTKILQLRGKKEEQEKLTQNQKKALENCNNDQARHR